MSISIESIEKLEREQLDIPLLLLQRAVAASERISEHDLFTNSLFAPD